MKLHGGARIGLLPTRGRWGTTMRVEPSTLELRVFMAGTYTFSPEHVVCFEKCEGLLLREGIRIHHVIPDYPEKIVFFCREDAKTTIQHIQDAGFHPTATSADELVRHGHPVRWQAMVGMVALWNLLFLVDLRIHDFEKYGPGPLAFLAILLLFLGCLTINRSRLLRHLIFKPDRSPGEVNQWVCVLRSISGLMLAGWVFLRLLR